MNVGTILGGSAINSVPANAEFLVDFRTIDSKTEELIMNYVEETANKYDAKIEIINKLSPFFNDSKYGNKTCGFITEAGFLPNEKIILGAGPITAHEVDEYIEEDSFNKLIEQYKKLIIDACR
jgi:acetylornithine deacetylase/succinyl-diaminopimelate desuccinylase-like protein